MANSRNIYIDAGQKQRQQILLQRPKEASKQMVYDVFGNVIGILEEFERREMIRHNLPLDVQKSKIDISPQDYKQDEDIRAILQTQMVSFENIIHFCPTDIFSEMVEELRFKVIGWAAVREEYFMRMKLTFDSETDYFLAKMYELLVTGRTDHEPLKSEPFTAETMLSGVQAYMKGQNKTFKLEEKFKRDPESRSKAPNIRTNEILRKGIQRLLRMEKGHDLQKQLKEDQTQATLYEEPGTPIV